MVEMNGLNGDQFPINVASWTVSTMLIVGTVIWGCLYYYGEKFRDFFMPVSILVLLGVWVHFENLSNSKWHVLFTAGMVRTWIEMCLGYYCLRLSELITVKDNPRVRKIALALIESLGYGLVLLSIYNGATRWHQLMTLLLMIPVVAITASGQSAWQDFFAWLTARLRISFDCVSFCVYLIHVPVILLFQSRYGSVFDADRTPYSARFFVCVALAAVVYYFCTKWLIKAFRKMAVPWKRFWTGA